MLERQIQVNFCRGRNRVFCFKSKIGAVDPLEQLAEVCSREKLWFHVDGAYGAFFHMVDELRPILRGMSLADSITLDPHKGLFLPYGTGCLLVRDAKSLRYAFSQIDQPGYLPNRKKEK